MATVYDTSEFGETPSVAGGRFYGVDVKICLGNAQELADPIDWAAILADSTQYEGGLRRAGAGVSIPTEGLTQGRHDNIRPDEIRELEGLFRHIYASIPERTG